MSDHQPDHGALPGDAPALTPSASTPGTESNGDEPSAPARRRPRLDLAALAASLPRFRRVPRPVAPEGSDAEATAPAPRRRFRAPKIKVDWHRLPLARARRETRVGLAALASFLILVAALVLNRDTHKARDDSTAAGTLLALKNADDDGAKAPESKPDEKPAADPSAEDKEKDRDSKPDPTPTGEASDQDKAKEQPGDEPKPDPSPPAPPGDRPAAVAAPEEPAPPGEPSRAPTPTPMPPTMAPAEILPPITAPASAPEKPAGAAVAPPAPPAGPGPDSKPPGEGPLAGAVSLPAVPAEPLAKPAEPLAKPAEPVAPPATPPAGAGPASPMPPGDPPAPAPPATPNPQPPAAGDVLPATPGGPAPGGPTLEPSGLLPIPAGPKETPGTAEPAPAPTPTPAAPAADALPGFAPAGPAIEPSPSVEPAPAPKPEAPASPRPEPKPAEPAPEPLPKFTSPPIGPAAPSVAAAAEAGAGVPSGMRLVPSLGKRRMPDPGRDAEARLAPERPVADAPLPREAVGSRDREDPILHTVESGENFWTISRTYYGSGRFYKALHAANRRNVPRIDELYVGTTIKVPPEVALDPALIDPPARSNDDAATRASRSTAAARPRPAATAAPSPADPATRSRAAWAARRDIDEPTRPSYRVRAHDTLRSIARDTLGDPHRYREILDLNPDALDGDGRLEPGASLVLPEDAVVRAR